MTKLSYSQAVLLSAAAARPDLSLLPVPDTIMLRGAALNRTVQSLLSRGLIAENAVDGRVKRTKGAGSPFAITPAGLTAIGVGALEVERDNAESALDAALRLNAAIRSERPRGSSRPAASEPSAAIAADVSGRCPAASSAWCSRWSL